MADGVAVAPVEGDGVAVDGCRALKYRWWRGCWRFELWRHATEVEKGLPTGNDVVDSGTVLAKKQSSVHGLDIEDGF